VSYTDFVAGKVVHFESSGFDVAESQINPMLFPFQRAIVRWALKRGRAAIFADTGLGKSFMQIEWAWNVFQHTGNRVLILAPLCVADQTVREAGKLGYPIKYVREFKRDGETGLYITNYEMLEHFEEAIRDGYFSGVVLDESSIIKHKDSKTRNQIIELFRNVEYKLSATATPSPNDYMELGNQCEFLGVMGMFEMLATYFIHDSGETSKWRLKGHGERKFWEWLAQWAVTIKRPSDLGFSDDGYDLPGLNVQELLVPSIHAVSDNTSLSGRNAARRLSIDERVEATAKLVNGSPGPWVIWCNLNDESEKLTKSIDGAVEIRGSDPIKVKEDRLLAFAEGKIRVLVTKPTIAGFGLNWQHCADMAFVGLNDSFEQLYQAIRRCYRFGQQRVVNVHLVSSTLEGAVRENLLNKERKAEEMTRSMVEHMRDFTKRELKSLTRQRTDYIPTKAFEVPQWLN
jgi:hypothetical protein